MGGKQSVHIETPTFNPSEWQYVVEETEPAEEYGLYRTLRHRKTGERINEYDFIWPNEEEYLYYLKSFNWRYRQPSLVNTRFISLSNSDQICSHSYTAKVYVEAVKVRVSEISDIPFPDNLYVVMEALEGYGKIFEHSKYFDVEENQICVDDSGNVKIWVNADLSINFPNSQSEHSRNAPEDMVEAIINIVASNTDPDTEPSPSFRQYFDQKKGRGKRFQQAKLIVMNYARLHETEIPDKFEAILNMDREDQDDANSHTDNSKSYNRINDRNDQAAFERWGQGNNAEYGNPQFYQEPPRQQQQQQQYYQQQEQQPVGSVGYSHVYAPPFAHPQQYVPQPVYHHQPVYHQNYVMPAQPQPVYYIPNYPRVEYAPRPINAPAHPSMPPAFAPQPLQPVSESVAQSNSRAVVGEQEQLSSNIENMRGTIITSLNENTGDFKAEKDEFAEEDLQLQADLTEKENRNTHMRNNSFGEQNHSISEADDLVARSLPIKAGYPSQTGQHLSSLAQNDRAIYSHINPKDQWAAANKDGFGLTNNSQLKLKESAHKTSKGKTEVMAVNPIKYFYSMDEELEIDPVIAADIAKYLN